MSSNKYCAGWVVSENLNLIPLDSCAFIVESFVILYVKPSYNSIFFPKPSKLSIVVDVIELILLLPSKIQIY